MTKTKIVATLGPATRPRERIARLMDAGVSVFRLNFSHGDPQEHAQAAELVRGLAEERHLAIAILQDLQGPKIRTGSLAGGQEVTLQEGDHFSITTHPILGNANLVSTTYSLLPQDVRTGDRILLDDGKIELRVLETDPSTIITVVVQGGLLQEHKGINLPGVVISAPALTQKDRADLEFGLSLGVDAIALSFVRKPEDIIELKEIIRAHGQSTPVIAKLEKPEALDHLDAILEAADGVMVARGDLGVELSAEKVPSAQKAIIEASHRKRKLVITATQMLESMIHAPQPTRAEASDIANAVFDGTDALMLSGETAIGEFPVEAGLAMATIAGEAERNLDRWGYRFAAEGPCLHSSEGVAHAALDLARNIDAGAIVAFTRSGRTALFLSKLRGAIPVIAMTPNAQTYRRLAFAWGVTPHLCLEVSSMQQILAEVDALKGVFPSVQAGFLVVLAGGWPVGKQSPTNFLLAHAID
ncbi:MAG: pyruvate kinase [Coprothermobacterota bacterium]|nr:pyruvate kinase [Coprothermobacterota bacterium]